MVDGSICWERNPVKEPSADMPECQCTGSMVLALLPKLAQLSKPRFSNWVPYCAIPNIWLRKATNKRLVFFIAHKIKKKR